VPVDPIDKASKLPFSEVLDLYFSPKYSF